MLADEMGLGKTVQSVTTLHHSLLSGTRIRTPNDTRTFPLRCTEDRKEKAITYLEFNVQFMQILKDDLLG